MKSTTFKWLNRSHVCATVALGMLLPMAVYAEHGHERNDESQGHSFQVRGIPVTGINELCGSSVFSLPVPSPVPPTIRATNLGEYNPSGVLPFPLTATNCTDDIVVTTTTDPGFLAATGSPDVDVKLKNIPLRQNYVITGQDGSRSQLPSLSQVPGNALPPTKSDPNGTITLGQWLNTQGNMEIKCNDDGKATVVARFHNLIPNGVYTMWGVWTTTPPGPPIVPVPFGGIPNVLIPDQNGKATFVRKLASCPKDVTQDGSRLMFVTLAYHSDNDINGTNPELGADLTTFHPAVGGAFTSFIVPGVATHDAMEFPINVEVLH